MKADKSSLAYELKDNVDPVRETISLWYKPLWASGQGSGLQRLENLFGFGRKEPRISSVQFGFGTGIPPSEAIWQTSTIRARPGMNRSCLRPGGHVAFTWNEQESHLYLDGKRAGFGRVFPAKKALQVSGIFMCSIEDFKRFFVGRCTALNRYELPD